MTSSHPHILDMTRVGSIEPLITRLYSALSPQELATSFQCGRNQSIETLVDKVLGI